MKVSSSLALEAPTAEYDVAIASGLILAPLYVDITYLVSSLVIFLLAVYSFMSIVMIVELENCANMATRRRNKSRLPRARG